MNSIQNAIDAAGRLQSARQSYHDAVLAALDSGVSVSDLARELGISRQAVNQLRLRARTKTPEPSDPEPSDSEIEARISELEGRWNLLVAAYADQWKCVGADRISQAERNGQARKRARKGLKPLPTVAADRLAFAESELYRYVHEHRSEPVFDACCRELAELESLSEIRETRMERKAGF